MENNTQLTEYFHIRPNNKKSEILVEQQGEQNEI